MFSISFCFATVSSAHVFYMFIENKGELRRRPSLLKRLYFNRGWSTLSITTYCFALFFFSKTHMMYFLTILFNLQATRKSGVENAFLVAKNWCQQTVMFPSFLDRCPSHFIAVAVNSHGLWRAVCLPSKGRRS